MRFLTVVFFIFHTICFGQKNDAIFISKDKIFSLKLPDDVTLQNINTSDFLAVAASNASRKWEVEHFEFTIQPYMTLDEFSEIQLKNQKKNKNQVLNYSGFEEIGLNKWWVIDYTTKSGTRYRCYQIIADNRRYSFYYIAPEGVFNDGMPVTIKMVESFSFLNGKKPENSITNSNVSQKQSTAVKSNTDKSINQNSLKAGTISPNVKYLDYDKLDYFFGRFAVVNKGDLQSLIDENGKLIHPFDNYGISSEADSYGGVASNINGRAQDRVTFFETKYGSLANYLPGTKGIKMYSFVKRTPNSSDYIHGYILPDGKIKWMKDILKNTGFEKVSLNQFSYDGYIITALTYGENSLPPDGRMISVKYDGARLIGKGNRNYSKALGYTNINYYLEETSWATPNDGLPDWNCGLHPARKLNYSEDKVNDIIKLREIKNKKIGFINRFGEFKIPPSFYKVGRFSEGLAFVCTLNEFGEERWGAIDTLGNLVIPYKFRSQPGRFSNGRSLVKAIGLERIEYAMINRRGEIVFTLPKNSGDTISIMSAQVNPVSEPFLYSNGYTCVSINTNARVKDNAYFVDTNGVYIPVLKKLRAHFPNGEMLYVRSGVKDGEFLFEVASNTKNGIGIADLSGSIIIDPVFTKLKLFEPESKLQYAEIGKRLNSDKSIEGYIDRSGVFQFVRRKEEAGF
ncbi:WG repeat-containing protein [Flavihumibacter sp. RY-1]|uniref:WG repeat-containing protein n=1 Tax=Flavihumibacter fluminis TaxID=2909236 RepID=A0ABS9BCF9_9BACT|nr:WG repeat-containing protein [Flavihumibacter fluminis]MCF1713316.1 WG repeat-containing protein [Flavihumibacter fluminis]